MSTESYNGAVCYIDLLGFSYLTKLLDNYEILDKNTEDLKFEDKKVKDISLCELRQLFEYIGNNNAESIPKNITSVSDWAFNIVDATIHRLHEVIEKACVDYQNVEYSVFSDSVFIISENADDILFVLSYVFRECVKSGILLRAGLAYGKYYKVHTHISPLTVYGPAVTRAVDYEKKGKGCRIFTDSDFPINCKVFSEKKCNVFRDYKNYQNYSNIDCFEWLMIKDKYVLNQSDLYLINSNYSKPIISLLEDNLIIFCNILCSTKFQWNVSTEEGLEQVACSIEYISSLIRFIYSLSSNKQLETTAMLIDDGFYQARHFKRSEKKLERMIKFKIEEIRKLYV